jgi:hypothetical protein
VNCTTNGSIGVEVLANSSITGKWTANLLSYLANRTICLELLANSSVFVEDWCIGAGLAL